MIVMNSLGQTDCKRSRFLRQSNKIFVQHVRVPDELRTSRFVSLPILVAVLASVNAAEKAIHRILEARKRNESIVDLTDLEDTHTLS